MTTSIKDADWNGTHIGSHKCGESKIRWGLYRVIVWVEDIPMVRVLDPDGLTVIADEMSGFFGLMKTGTIRFKCISHTYTGYSFMTGERQYCTFFPEGDYDLDNVFRRWETYYSWWNIAIKPEDAYIRKFYGTDKMVIYPSTALRKDTTMEGYGIGKTKGMDDDMLRVWLNCYNEDDIISIVNRARHILEVIINRINPELIIYAGIFISRLSRYLSYYLLDDQTNQDNRK